MSESQVHTSTVELVAEDGHRLSAYVADPGNARKALVVLQEIFGVNGHIRSVTERFAAEGFLAIAPALFDRAERGVEMPYDQQSSQRGMQMVKAIGTENTLKDVAAALEYAAEKVGTKNVGVVGYCWGGSMAWLAATRLAPDAAVAYYGGMIAQYVDEVPKCPIMLHFGAHDPHISRDSVEKIREAHPEIPIHLYDAGHGFNCDERESYAPEAARMAQEETLKFLKATLHG